MRMPTRPRRLAKRPAVALSAVALGVTLVAAGCGGGDDEAGASAAPTADFVPASAPVYIEVDSDTESDQWMQVSQLGQKFPSWPGGSVDELLDDALSDADVSYADDVKPVLGDSVAIAVPTIESSGVGDALSGTLDPASAVDDQDRYLAVIEITDEDKLRSLIEDEAGQPAGDHGGVEYYENDDSFAAIWDGAFVVAATEEDLFASIDAHAAGGEATLAGQDKFNQTLEALSPEVVGQMYVDIGRVIELAAADQPQLEQLGVEDVANAAFGASLTAEPDGFRVKGAIVGAVVEDQPTFDPSLADNAPADTLVYYGFANLAKQIQTSLDQALAASENGDETRQQLEAFSSQLQSLLGISLDDLIALASGEHALVVEPGGSSPDIPVTGALVLKVDDAARAQQTLDAIREGLPTVLSSLGADPGQIAFKEVQVAPGVTGYELPLDDGISAVYAIDGDLAVIGASVDAVRQVLAPAQPLSSNDAFTEAIADAPSPISGLLWVDVEGAVELADREGAFAGEPEARDNLRPVKDLVMWMAPGDTPTFEAFLRIE